jgi:tRNA modification GTPase
MTSNDTICALATPAGTGGVAIIRVSGDRAITSVDQLVKTAVAGSIGECVPRMMVPMVVSGGGTVVDRGLAVYFPNPHSYTGEDVVELHVHGSMVVVEVILDLLVQAGARPAEPGEFTRRAFLNGKLDLTQVEGLSDVIAAEDRAGLEMAQRQLGGELGRKYEGFRQDLITLLGRLELELDFIEEGYSFLDRSEIIDWLGSLLSQVEGLIACYRAGGVRSSGVRVVLVGEPNSGKSSLFNSLVGYGRSIVSPVAGTTRDYVEETVMVGSRLWRFVDTAGLRVTADTIEGEGIERAYGAIGSADIVLFLIDSSSDSSERQRCLSVFHDLKQRFPESCFVLCWSKSDLSDYPDSGIGSTISIVNPDSLQNLWSGLNELSMALKGVDRFSISLRQKDLLEQVKLVVLQVLDSVNEPSEVLSSELRRLFDPLSRLTGRISVDDVLFEVFGSFCIGK